MGHPTKKVQIIRRGKAIWVDEQILRFTRRKRKERKAENAARERPLKPIFSND